MVPISVRVPRFPSHFLGPPQALKSSAQIKAARISLIFMYIILTPQS